LTVENPVQRQSSEIFFWSFIKNFPANPVGNAIAPVPVKSGIKNAA
jgi:hypothetical protein